MAPCGSSSILFALSSAAVSGYLHYSSPSCPIERPATKGMNQLQSGRHFCVLDKVTKVIFHFSGDHDVGDALYRCHFVNNQYYSAAALLWASLTSLSASQ